MRVNISYSVELTELLNHLYNLYTVEETSFRLEAQQLHEVLGKSYTEEDLLSIIQAIKGYRELITSFDIKLSELANILDGYYKIKYEPPLASEEVATEEKTNE